MPDAKVFPVALTAAVWHNDHLGLTIRRSLIAYDH